MNWELGDQNFKPKKIFGLISEYYVSPDAINNKRFDVVGYFKEGFKTDTLGYIDFEEFKKIASEREIDTTIIKSDTIFGIKKYLVVEEQLKPFNSIDSLEIPKDPTIDGMVLYILDKTNNTVLNVFEAENQKYSVDLPRNQSFTVVAFGIKNQQPYVFRKAIRLNKDEILKTKFEKIEKNKLSNFLDTI